MSSSAASPGASPRLPSPPPFTEVQIGPKSPTVSDGLRHGDAFLGVPEAHDEGSSRRIRPGTKAADMASGPPLVPLAQLDSPFQLQEHIKASYHHFTRPPGSDSLVPITRDIARQLADPPEGVERSLWLYELCRFLTMKANNLVIAFFAEDPPCSAQTCPEMRASEWQYLCAVHDPPKSCCAIDYCCHTLDWATNVLTSPKLFPSRLTLGSDAAGGPQAGMRHLTNVFRRVYRIFAHAWFQHREVFWQVEGHDGLYVFFKTVCDTYNLIPEDNYTIPPEAEGEDQDVAQDQNRRLTILKKSDTPPLVISPNTEEPDHNNLSAATTRRHRHSPSTGISVTTIAEAAEDDDQSKNIQSNMSNLLSKEEELDPEEIDDNQSVITSFESPSAEENKSAEVENTPVNEQHLHAFEIPPTEPQNPLDTDQQDTCETSDPIPIEIETSPDESGIEEPAKQEDPNKTSSKLPDNKTDPDTTSLSPTGQPGPDVPYCPTPEENSTNEAAPNTQS
ncbi:hypothetical protein FQN57_005967 [Myotisia sp. PD_48]|nr:hypothetical protein FQN57_005967 [Myotisia sp. PD_48]